MATQKKAKKRSAAQLIDALPILPESVLGETAMPDAAWRGSMGNVLPAMVQPHLNQELQELVKYAQFERIELTPVGGASYKYVGAHARAASAVLLVQPGMTTLWSGVERVNHTAWIPAGHSVVDAEAQLNAEGFTMSLWPQDSGSMGGNWVLPRGSFGIREFLAPGARRLGVEALFGNGEWMKVREVPRSAAGPNVARFMHGLGGSVSLITRVRVAVRPLSGRRSGVAEVTDLVATLNLLRSMMVEDRLPTAVTLTWDGGRGQLWWQNNLTSSWDELVYEYAASALGLEEGEQDAPAADGLFPRSLNWKELLALAEAGKNFPNVLCGASMTGMVELMPEPVPISDRWMGWLQQAATRKDR